MIPTTIKTQATTSNTINIVIEAFSEDDEPFIPLPLPPAPEMTGDKVGAGKGTGVGAGKGTKDGLLVAATVTTALTDDIVVVSLFFKVFSNVDELNCVFTDDARSDEDETDDTTDKSIWISKFTVHV